LLKTILAIIFLIAVFVFGGLWGYAQYYHLLLFLSFNLILVSLIFYLRSNLVGLGLYRTDSFLSALDKLLMIIFCSILLWVSPFQESFKIEWFIYAQTAALVIAALTIAFFVRKNLPIKINFNLDLAFTVSLLKKSFPFALVIFLTTIFTRFDVLMIDIILPDGNYHIGAYGGGYRLLDASNMIGFLFATLLLPMLSRMLKVGEDINQLVGLGFKFIFAGSVAFAASIFFFQEEIMFLLYDEATPYWGDILGWLMLGFVAVAGTYIYGTLMLAHGDLDALNKIFAVSILFNVGLNFWLIPKYQAEGAAIATLITQSMVLVAEILLTCYKKLLRVNIPLLFKSITYFVGCLVIGYCVYSYGFEEWIPAFLGSFFGCLLLSVLLGFLDFRAFLNLNFKGAN